MQWFPQLKKIEWMFLFTLIAVFLGLTLVNITRLPIFVDEALYLRWAQIAWHDASWRFISLTDGKQPLYIWFVIPFMKIISDPLAAGRTASAFAGLVTMLGMGYLGYLVKGKKLGFYAMILTMFSPYLYFYYRFGIMESLLVAAIVWVCNFSILLARTRQLDLALILGMATGMALLVKSSALFFCLLIPAAYLLTINFRKPLTKSTFQYVFLVLISWTLAFIIYNVQRLSPWMHMIAEKNAFFTVPYSEIFAEFARLSNNFLDVWRWQIAYTTLPVLALSVLGAYTLIRSHWRMGLLILVWLLGPMLGTIAVARLFAPRYIIYVTPFVLIFAAYGVSQFKTFKSQLIATILALIYPTVLISRLIIDPLDFPYAPVDQGYVNGWSAGNGTRQIADWAVMRVESTTQPVTIFTEGTFGILPHGLELYTDGRVKNLTITGIYPVNELPPKQALLSASTNPETYLVMNNTPTPDIPPGLELIASYPKLESAYSMRLFRVLPTKK